MNQTEATPVPQSTTDYGKRTFQLCHFLHQIFFTPKFYFTNFLLFRTICYSNFSHQNFYYTNFLLFRTIFYTNFLLHQFFYYTKIFSFLHQFFITPKKSKKANKNGVKNWCKKGRPINKSYF
mgnify:CR=1 FL=1